MGWRRAWDGIAARIDGLSRATELFAATITGTDIYMIQARAIIPELRSIRRELVDFVAAHGSELPPAAIAAVTRFTESDLNKVEPSGANGISTVIPIAVLRHEVDYLIRDQHEDARTITELAFEHLRRLVVVDDEVREKWQHAFAHRETSCERLGAVHLLNHGIWAFKVSSVGAATDLVFGDPIDRHAPEVQRTARALVATEWKVVRDRSELVTKAAEARTQLALYARGPLADLTLTSTRFAVLVSEKDLAPPPDLTDAGITYRHISIAVDPGSPSKTARGPGRRAGR